MLVFGQIIAEHGLSRRQAVSVLNFIFTEMKNALRRGREVEFPFGRLTRARRHFSKHWDAIKTVLRIGSCTRWSGNWTKRVIVF